MLEEQFARAVVASGPLRKNGWRGAKARDYRILGRERDVGRVGEECK
jgi:hypothetical protein